jgi:uncharacterized membrane protein
LVAIRLAAHPDLDKALHLRQWHAPAVPDSPAPDRTDPTPAWRRRTAGEHRIPAAVAVAAVITLQLLLPDRMVPQARYALPVLEGVLLVLLVLVNPFRIDRESMLLRVSSLALSGVVVVANGWSVVLLVLELLSGRTETPGGLLAAGGAVWLTNMLAFALLFWELDRGGPAARAAGVHDRPDFLFPQMQSPDLAGPDWEPYFADYLYLAFTNATAFSPTDVLPFSRWAKLLMMVQSAVSLTVVVLVVARAVNVLG